MPEPTYSDDYYAHLHDRANAVAAELHRAYARLRELVNEAEHRDLDAEHAVRGETIGLRNALGIFHRFIEHVGDNYYMNWMKEQKDQCPSRVHSLWDPCPDDCTKPTADETQPADSFAAADCPYGKGPGDGSGCIKPAGHDGDHVLTAGVPVMPCSRAVLHQPHLPHSWWPQPGMAYVHCPGSTAAAQQAGESR